MKLYAIYSKYNEKIKNDWFLPSLTDEFDLNLKEAFHHGGAYKTDGFRDAVLEKSNLIISAIKKNMGEVFVYSDVDIQFFRPVKSLLLEAIKDHHIVCQREHPGDDAALCSGFFVIKASYRTLRLWELVHDAIKREGRDQAAFNRILRELKQWTWNVRYRCPEIKYGYLPSEFFGGGTLTRRQWSPGMDLPVPQNIVLHHANYTVGNENKITQLQYVRDIVQRRKNDRT